MKRLGILGGMGPAASAEFVTRLINQTPATCDQEHIPFVLWSDPTVPDRSTSLINRDDFPWDKLKQGIIGLKSVGCDHIAIPCNTAHFWYDRMAQLGIPITHIVGSVADELKELKVYSGAVGIIGTKATMRLGLYQDYLNKQGWSCVTPGSQDIDNFVQPAIDLIKANDINAARDLLYQVMDNLKQSGVKAIVLGCTELPLAIKDVTYKNLPIVNSIDSLVKSVIIKHKRQ
jgi:aspartate racemase